VAGILLGDDGPKGELTLRVLDSTAVSMYWAHRTIRSSTSSSSA
jgi:hypothetical protein